MKTQYSKSIFLLFFFFGIAINLYSQSTYNKKDSLLIDEVIDSIRVKLSANKIFSADSISKDLISRFGDTLLKNQYVYKIARIYKKKHKNIQYRKHLMKSLLNEDKTVKLPEKELVIYLTLAGDYSSAGEYEKAEEIYNIAMQLISNKDVNKLPKSEQVEIADFYSGYIYFLFRTGKIESLPKYLSITKGIYEKFDVRRGIRTVNFQFARNYYLIKEYEKSTDILKSIIKNDTTLNSFDISTILSSIGSNFIKQNKIDSAFVYYNKAIKVDKENNNLKSLIISYNNLGNLLRDNKRHFEAKSYYQKGLELLEISKIRYDLLIMNSVRNEIALDNYETAYLNFKKIKDDDQLRSNSKFYILYTSVAAAIMKAKNNYREAVNYLEESYRVADSINNAEINDRIVKLQTEYEVAEKKRENELLVKDNELQELALRQEKITRYLLLMGIVILFGLIYMVYRRFISSKKRAKVLEEKNKIITIQKEQINSSLLKEKELNEDLNSANRSLQRFFSIIAHDLRSPFNITLGYTNILMSSYDVLDRKEVKNYIEIIRKSIQRNYKLTQNLLTWVSTQLKGIDIQRENANVNKVVIEAIESYEDLIKKKKIKLINKIPNDLQGYFDRNVVTTVIANLTNNAIKFTPTNGSVTIIASKEENKINFIVEDTGTGISKERIDDFYKLDKISSKLGTNNEKGTGLGLLLCKQLISHHKGDIKINSKEGKGTSILFYVT